MWQAPADAYEFFYGRCDMEEKKVMTMEQDLRGWGIGLLIMGGLHFVIPILSKEWGMVLIPLGLLSLVIMRRGMFIAIGFSLMLVGTLNLIGGLGNGSSFWLIFGGLQVYWGIKELAKFGMYGKVETQEPLSEEAETENFDTIKQTQEH